MGALKVKMARQACVQPDVQFTRKGKSPEAP